jgi:uncharacterized protein (DUF58 family)
MTQAAALRELSPELPHLLWHPIRHARARLQRWWQARLVPVDTLTLTQRNVYILPTRPGLMLGITLLVLLIGSINYQLNLGYLLTFLLAGSAVVGVHLGHGTLSGMTLSLLPHEPQFANRQVLIGIRLSNPGKRRRFGIGLSLGDAAQWTWTDVPSQGDQTVQLAFQPGHRGLHPVPAITAETRFPLGTFRVWTVWRAAMPVMVYPAPEDRPPALPVGEPSPGRAVSTRRQSSGETDGVRPYRRGDPLKLIVWKKLARAGEMVSRDTSQRQQVQRWLDLQQTGLHHTEQQLERLCAWVLEAERQGADYGLRLGSLEIAPGRGEEHRRRCLQALALHR